MAEGKPLFVDPIHRVNRHFPLLVKMARKDAKGESPPYGVLILAGRQLCLWLFGCLRDDERSNLVFPAPLRLLRLNCSPRGVLMFSSPCGLFLRN